MKKFFLLLVSVFIFVGVLWIFASGDANGDRPWLKALTNKELNNQTLSPKELQEQFPNNEQRGQPPNKNDNADNGDRPLEILEIDFFDENNAIPVCCGNDDDQNNNNDHEIHSYKGFTLCYRESYEDAEWVAYVLTREELNAVTGRTNDFRPDSKITTGSSDLTDYKKSGYDRGHLAPAADMEWSVESCRESFLMSNMTPQAPQLNRGMWQQLESQVRKWAEKFGKVIVVTGPVLEKKAEDYPSIGANKVAVPEYFFKSILAQTQDGTAIAINFIMPNSKCEGTIWDYCVTTDEVESRCGFDIFSFLPDSEEKKVESSINLAEWQ